MSDTKWKDYLLKSGLPLEYEVKKRIEQFNVYCKPETSYLRKNENNINKEFSYDIDATYWVNNHDFNLLIECKYRDENTNWLFLPENYNKSPRGIGTSGFLHTIDFFYPKKYFNVFKFFHLLKISELCSKGIEITKSGQNPNSIDRAISQLSYAMIDKVIHSLEDQIHQAESEQEDILIFHNIPIIVTTANLYRLKPNISIKRIKECESINDIATKHNMLLIEISDSKELKEYANKKLLSFKEKFSKDKLNQLINNKEFNLDIDAICEQVSDFPHGIIILQHSNTIMVYKKLFKLLDEIDNPSENTKAKLKKLADQLNKLSL